MKKTKSILKYVFAFLFIFAGVKHFTNTDFFMSIMPPYLPWHLAIVYISGVVEIILGIALLVKKLQTIAAWGLIALLIAVFPANIHMAINSELYPQFSSTALYIRLVLQGVLVLWAYWYTKQD